MDAASTPPVPTEPAVEVSSAFTAAMLGVMSMALGMTTCCTSVLGMAASTVVGGIALFMGKALLDRGPEGEARAYATIAAISGGISLVWGLVLMAVIGVYVAMYVVLVVAAVVAG